MATAARLTPVPELMWRSLAGARVSPCDRKEGIAVDVYETQISSTSTSIPSFLNHMSHSVVAADRVLLNLRM